jgi:hypothetical protein
VCLGRGRGDSIIIALADVRGRKLAPGAGALRSSHDFGFRFTGSGFENAFSPFERPVKPRGSDAVHNSRPDRFLTAQKRALKFARSSNRRIPHVERSAFEAWREDTTWQAVTNFRDFSRERPSVALVGQ